VQIVINLEGFSEKLLGTSSNLNMKM